MPKRRAARGRGRGAKSNASQKAKEQEPDTSFISISADEKEDGHRKGGRDLRESSENQHLENKDNDVSKTVLENVDISESGTQEIDESILNFEENTDEVKAGENVEERTELEGKSKEPNASTISISADEKVDGNSEGGKELIESIETQHVKSEDDTKAVLESVKDSESGSQEIEEASNVIKEDQAGCVENIGSTILQQSSGAEDARVPESLENEEIKTATSSNKADDSIPNTSNVPEATTKADESSEQNENGKQNDDLQKELTENVNDTLDDEAEEAEEKAEEAEEMFVDKEVDDDVQYIDEEIEEVDDDGVQDLVDVMEMGDKDNVNANQKKETMKETKTVGQRSASVNKEESKAKGGEKEDVADTTFEEISEGSMDPMEQEAVIEAISDNEIIIDSSSQCAEEVKATSTNKERDTSPFIIDDDEEDETLADIFEVTENDDHNVAVQDNDDISDTSLCDNEDEKNNLSLEEISDDDLESSKRKNMDTSTQPPNSTGQEVDKATEDGAAMITVSDISIDETPEKDADKDKDAETDAPLCDDEDNAVSLKQDENESKETRDQNQESSEQTAQCLTTDSDKEKDDKDKTQEQQIVVPSTQSTEDPKVKSSQKPAASQLTSTSKNDPTQIVPSKKNGPLVVPQTASSAAPVETPSFRRRGKIIQCSINRIGSSNMGGMKKEELDAKIKNNVSEIIDKFKSHLPSSVVDIFPQVASTNVYNKGTYSLSLGPVTSADFKNDQFRDICFNSAEKFNITFNSKMQGLLEAQFSKHKEVNRVIHNLKCLDLGIRYMILSLRHRTNENDPSQQWHAILIFTYNQDESQMKAWRDANDGKVRSRLTVTGVPEDISKDFVQLLFPEALYITTGLSEENGRALTLGFSSTKTTKDIASTYELLLFNGVKVEVSSMDPVLSEIMEETPASGFVEEDGTVIVEDVEEEEVTPVTCEDKEDTDKQMEITPDVDDKTNGDDKQKDDEGEGTSNAEVDASSVGMSLGGGNEEIAKDKGFVEKDEPSSKDSEKIDEIHIDETQEEPSKEGEDKDIDENKDEVKGKDEEMEVEGVENSDKTLASEDGGISEEKANSSEMEVEATREDELRVDKGAEGEHLQESMDNATTENVNAGTTDASQEVPGDEGEGISIEKEKTEKSGEDVTLQSGDLQTANESSVEKGSMSEDIGKESLETINDAESEKQLEASGEDKSGKGDSAETQEEMVGCQKAPEDDKVDETQHEQPDKSQGGKSTEGDKDENLEDVSDDEILGTETTKAVEPDDDDDVIILKEELPKKVVANIDLTEDDPDSPVKAEDSNGQEETEVKEEIKLEDLVDDDIITMTDGDFEVRLESIDVEVEESESESKPTYGEYRGKYYNSDLIRDLTESYHQRYPNKRKQQQQQQNTGFNFVPSPAAVVRDKQPLPPPHVKRVQNQQHSVVREQPSPEVGYNNRVYGRPEAEVRTESQRNYEKISSRHSGSSLDDKSSGRHPVPSKEETAKRREPSKRDCQRSQSPSPRRDVSERVTDPPSYHHSNLPYSAPSANTKQQSYPPPTSNTKQQFYPPPSGNPKQQPYPPSGNPKQQPYSAPSGNLKQQPYPPSGNPKQQPYSAPSGNPKQQPYPPPSGNPKQQPYSNYNSSNTSRSYNKSYRDHRGGDSPPPSRQSHHHQPSSSSYYDYKNTRPSDDYKNTRSSDDYKNTRSDDFRNTRPSDDFRNTRPSDDFKSVRPPNEYSTASRSRQGNNSKYESSSNWRDERRSSHQQKPLPVQTRHVDKTRSFSPLSVSSSELITSPPAKKSRRVSHSPISASSRSLSPISKSPSPPLQFYGSSTKYASNKYRQSPAKTYKDKDKYSPISTRDLDIGRGNSGQRRSRSRSPYKNWEREKTSRRSRSPQYRRRSPSPSRERIHQGHERKVMVTTSSPAAYRPSHAEPTRPAESSRNRTSSERDIIRTGISKYESLIKALYESKKKVAAAATAVPSFSSSSTKQKQGNVSTGSGSNKRKSNTPYEQTSSSTPTPGYKSMPPSSSKTTIPQQQQQYHHHHHQQQQQPQQQQQSSSHMVSQNYPASAQPTVPATNYMPQQPSMFYPTNPAMYNQYNMGVTGGMNAAYQAYGQQQQQQAMNNAMMYSYMHSASTAATTSTSTNNPYAAYANTQQQVMQRPQQQTAMNVPGKSSSSSSKQTGYQGQGGDKQKHWTMGDGGNALMFQRILSSSNKGKK